MTTAEYLDAVRVRFNLDSWAATARYLDVSEQTLRLWRRGHTMADAQAVRVADLLDIDAGRVLADIAAERTDDATVRAAWRRVAKMLSDGEPVRMSGDGQRDETAARPASAGSSGDG